MNTNACGGLSVGRFTAQEEHAVVDILQVFLWTAYNI